MLIKGSQLTGRPILSLHVGGEIARITELIIDPNNLKLIAFRVDGPVLHNEEVSGNILPIESVREFSHLGLIIDSSDELVGDTDIIRIKDVLKLNFSLPGLKVVTKRGSKLGKVLDFVLDVSGWQVYQLVVQRPPLKALLDPELLISHESIVEVTDYKIIVKSEYEAAPMPAVNVASANLAPGFVNPFRKAGLAGQEASSSNKTTS